MGGRLKQDFIFSEGNNQFLLKQRKTTLCYDFLTKSTKCDVEKFKFVLTLRKISENSCYYIYVYIYICKELFILRSLKTIFNECIIRRTMKSYQFMNQYQLKQTG